MATSSDDERQEEAGFVTAKPTESQKEFHLVFILEPDGFRHRIVVSALSTLKQLKEQVTKDLQLSQRTLHIPELDDGTSLRVRKCESLLAVFTAWITHDAVIIYI
jgi:hypothetical protein